MDQTLHEGVFSGRPRTLWLRKDIHRISGGIALILMGILLIIVDQTTSLEGAISYTAMGTFFIILAGPYNIFRGYQIRQRLRDKTPYSKSEN